jgi:hypothetical protein
MSRTKRSKSSRKRPVAKRPSTPPAVPAKARTLDELEASFDKFVLPGRIPDASDPYWKLSRAEQAEWRARGLAHAAGRGWQPVPSGGPVPMPETYEYDDLPPGHAAESAPRAPERRRSASPWPKGWIPGDPPIDHVDGPTYELSHELEADPAAAMRVFDAPARVRFLDCLATVGEVAAAARRVGISRETAYRARRRFPDFARLWDAALLHARARAEGELASRALDGVKVPVFVRGECVATYRKHDARYLFALLARLDRHAAECPDAADLAGRFDAMLALHAGHALPDGFAEAAGLWDDEPPARNARPRVPTRDEFAAWCADEAMEGVAEQDEDRAMAQAEAMAREEYDCWHEEAMDTLDAALAGGAREGESEAGTESPHPPAGGGDGRHVTPITGGPVEPTAASDRPAPNPSRKREGDTAAPIEPTDPPIEFKSAPASLRWRAALARGVSELSKPLPRTGAAARGGRTLPPVRTHL